ncbi:predicted protein [Histoplasma mississippiense (nom. inval.)]|uniref:predicted protein n=1 Tax=Ajellomyces capsulatus (strain NAm1 / WU24) TaxID=2059318 RepID=UPI000157B730|nr:predicted protein [Histoplasma mississippiense (nom. inval.)]EDN03658.1 predicted protein [Histoplasma mississippiense (nom. inval.)]
MSTDPEGDSEMLSTSESSQSSEPQTPTGGQIADETSNFPSSELSPPGSQDATGAEPTKMEYGDVQTDYAAVTASQHITGDGAGSGASWDNQSSAIARAEPGSSWNNKKAEEEYQRALEIVVDRDFGLKEFGDPFDDRDMVEQ